MFEIDWPSWPWAKLHNDDKLTIIAALLFLSLLWTLLFLLFRRIIFPRMSFGFSNRLVSVVHVFVALVLTTLSFGDMSGFLRDVGGPNSPEQALAITVSLSYFSYDFVCCLFEVPLDVVMSVHHVFTLMGLAYGIIAGQCGTELVACIWLMELSNPFMHARELLKEIKGQQKGQASGGAGVLSTVNDLLFALTFTFARMVVGPYVVYYTLKAEDSPIPIKMGAVGIQVVSLFWFYKILRVVYYKVIKGGKKGPKGSKTE
eukprot:TRINITY_DN2576_c0_g1_i1.p1 TRINITY_DN2576_c0_g1~~TRINITY_DN2576_c0_g1_i1.p1  ORF type:complete len:259 (-),score=31.69 TRINITY_DN2576_c0_g1_i1:435-1211(-)